MPEVGTQKLKELYDKCLTTEEKIDCLARYLGFKEYA